MIDSRCFSGEGSGAWNALASDPELLGDFILESREHLATIESQLLILEQDPVHAEAIHTIFRGFHTIKGLAGFLDLSAIRDVAHEVETVLDLARDFKLNITPRVIDCILASKDYLASWMTVLSAFRDTGKHQEFPPMGTLLEDIRKITVTPDPIPEDRGQPKAPPIAPRSATAPEPNIPLTTGLDELSNAVCAPTDPHRSNSGAGRLPASKGAAESGAIKVHTAKLDYLVDMLGEMVIAQSLVQHDPEVALKSNPRLARNLSQLARITEEVQKTAMSMRMVPIGQLFRKMARLVRDLSKKAGKPTELELEGEDTELDRTIVDELADPLMHMLRNAVDHGVENPEERERAGKHPVARILLKAGHQAGHISIQVADDGRGLDREKILRKAQHNGLIDGTEQLAESEIFNLIFQPGFSTAEQVTDVSGRGVGMDVVRKHIQKLRGRIDIESSPGRGTTFLIKLPLTLAIIDGLVVGVGKERYIVPIFAVKEMLRPDADMLSTVENRSEMALVRGSLLPVIRLHSKFGVEPRSYEAAHGLLIVSESNDKRFCLLVDDLVGKQEVVIKSLGPTLQGIPGVAGGAILGDGRVGLILDVEGLYGAARRD